MKRLMKRRGAALATDDLDLNGAKLRPVDDDDSVDSRLDQDDPKGDVGIEELLRDLLGALGIVIGSTTTEAEFKRALYEAAMTKIRELTGNGGGTGGKQSSPNPLMTGHTSDLREEVAPAAFSLQQTLARIERIADPHQKSIALALADAIPLAARQKEEQARQTAWQREARVNEAKGRRQQVIERCLKLNPGALHEINVLLNAPSAAFSVDDTGTVKDPMQQRLESLLQRLQEERLAARTKPTPATKDNLAEAESALVRALCRGYSEVM